MVLVLLVMVLVSVVLVFSYVVGTVGDGVCAVVVVADSGYVGVHWYDVVSVVVIVVCVV